MGVALTVDAWLVAPVAVFGALIGSFLNVVIWRVPRGESLVHPPSACPRCGTRIKPWDNIPVVSWLILRGKCRSCHAPIAWRYPLVEALTAAVFVMLTVRFSDDPAAWPAWWYFAAIGVALAFIDLDVKRLPNVIVLPAYAVGAALLGLAVVWGESSAWDGVRAVIGAAVLFGLYGLLWVVKPGGMGLGDVKLAGVLGGYLGWIGFGALAVGAFAAFLLGGLWAIGMVVFGSAGRKSKVPFGPWMILGALVGAVAGERLWSAYMALII